MTNYYKKSVLCSQQIDQQLKVENYLGMCRNNNIRLTLNLKIRLSHKSQKKNNQLLLRSLVTSSGG